MPRNVGPTRTTAWEILIRLALHERQGAFKDPMGRVPTLIRNHFELPTGIPNIDVRISEALGELAKAGKVDRVMRGKSTTELTLKVPLTEKEVADYNRARAGLLTIVNAAE